MKRKPIKWRFKWWCRCCSKTVYLHEFDLYLGKKGKKQSLGLMKQLFWVCLRNSKIDSVCFILTIFLILQHWLRIFLIGQYAALVQFEVTGKIWLLWKKIKMKRGDIDLQYANNVIVVKWFDNRWSDNVWYISCGMY